ncbi:MAG: hypothetical protein JSW61_12570 [Candidatus Thorarchaeota archaeon]|nr:MAG: hypothetical protein JSW61_12570 [Candidatus Thorarchaeota archaeon]
MSPHRIVFEEPIVRTHVGLTRFPDRCPICGLRATKKKRIDATPKEPPWAKPPTGRRLTTIQRIRLGLKPVTFIVPFCEEHVDIDSGRGRMRVAATYFFGLATSILIIAIMFVGSDLWLGRGVPFWAYPFLGIYALCFAAFVLTYRPSELESSVKVIGFDVNRDHVFLQFKDKTYTDEFLLLNKSNAELVSWIVRV